MNAVLETIQNRYSCRSYTGQPLTAGQLQAIARAAVQAPSAMNLQRWRIVMLTDKALIDEMEAEAMEVLRSAEDKSAYQRILSRGGKLFYGAPALAWIAVEQDADAQGTALDCGIVAQNITLAAASLGLASCICGMAGLAFARGKNEYFAEKLGFPPDYAPGIAVLLGTAAASKPPHEADLSKISYIG